jgi:FkbM family methyltransferase
MDFDYKGERIYLRGRKEKRFRELEIMNFIQKNYSLTNEMVDCGANYGNHTIYFAKFGNFSKVYSFEPIPQIFDVLNENIKLNKIEHKVESFNLGVSKKEKELKLISKIDETQGAFWFWYDGEDYVHPRDMGYGVHRKQQLKALKVLSLPLDKALENKENIDFMKIDVEGMEFEVLCGAKNLIDTNRPLLYIEVCLGQTRNIKDWADKNKYKIIKNNILHGHHWLLESR